MSPFDFFCPCCTGALLHSLAQTSTSSSTPQLFLELGQGALVAAIAPLEVQGQKKRDRSSTVPSHR